MDDTAHVDLSTLVDLGALSKYIGQEVSVAGWITRQHAPGSKLMFIDLFDGTGSIQLVIKGAMVKPYRKLLFEQTCVSARGQVEADSRSLSGFCMQLERVQIVGPGSGEFTKLFNSDSDSLTKMQQRHNLIRDPTTGQAQILRLRASLEGRIYRWFEEQGWIKVSPPAIVTGQCEGGATLFPLAIKPDYFGKPAYLTQSSQFYLETVVPAFKRVWCLEKSFRAEPHCDTPRHLCEYTHLEGELGFCDLVGLMEHLTSLVCAIADFKPDQFAQVTYRQALELLNRDQREQGTDVEYSFGLDLTDSMERRLMELYPDKVQLLFVTHYPKALKSFYMKPDPADPEQVLCCDLLLRGVGEVVGASVREDQLEPLIERMKAEGLDLDSYAYYLDLRRFGSCPHAGYGLGLERLIKYLGERAGLTVRSVRECCLYPRSTGRAYQ